MLINYVVCVHVCVTESMCVCSQTPRLCISIIFKNAAPTTQSVSISLGMKLMTDHTLHLYCLHMML